MSLQYKYIHTLLRHPPSILLHPPSHRLCSCYPFLIFFRTISFSVLTPRVAVGMWVKTMLPMVMEVVTEAADGCN